MSNFINGQNERGEEEGGVNGLRLKTRNPRLIRVSNWDTRDGKIDKEGLSLSLFFVKLNLCNNII